MKSALLWLTILAVPHSVSAAECPASRPESFQSLAAYAGELKKAFEPRSEFEKTVDYEARRRKAVETVAKPVALFYRIGNSEFTYDADSGSLHHRRGLESVSEATSIDPSSMKGVELSFADNDYKTDLNYMFDFSMKSNVAEIFRTSSHRNSIDYIILVEPREPYIGFRSGRLTSGRYYSYDIVFAHIKCVYVKAFDIYPE